MYIKLEYHVYINKFSRSESSEGLNLVLFDFCWQFSFSEEGKMQSLLLKSRKNVCMARLTFSDIIIADNIRPRILEKKTIYQYLF